MSDARTAITRGSGEGMGAPQVRRTVAVRKAARCATSEVDTRSPDPFGAPQ
ncbi:hypothetical protein [Methanoculleus bourgensis]|uniref:hypothetical protein n=1 Tax=Methanoculleus bourgensis TaxID=83986 RepID=UPI00249278CC|nr:hypothetical protein [Methanoculleus bourgensis]